MTALVTGATGLVGSHIVRLLLESGYDVRILRRESSSTKLIADLESDVEQYTGDVTDREAVRNAVDGAKVVFHVAGAVGLGGRRFREHLFAVNVGGTAAVADAAVEAGVERLVHTSSIAALGRPEPGDGDLPMITEETEWVESRATSEYARSKRGAELEVFRAIAEGLDAVMVNPSLVFGRGRSSENTVRIIERIRDRKLPAVPLGGTAVVDAIDVASGHLKALESGSTGEKYILSGENLSWREIVDTIANGFGVQPQQRMLSPKLAYALASVIEAVSLLPGLRPLITREAARQTSVRFRYDHAKARRELNMTFRPFSETVQRVAGQMSAA